ncbi:hypothetical protein SCJ03_12575, partial [Legionella pneumophila serogroup 1]
LLGRSLRKTVVKISNFKVTGLLRRYAPRNDGPKNRTVQRKICLLIAGKIIYNKFILYFLRHYKSLIFQHNKDDCHEGGMPGSNYLSCCIS